MLHSCMCIIEYLFATDNCNIQRIIFYDAYLSLLNFFLLKVFYVCNFQKDIKYVNVHHYCFCSRDKVKSIIMKHHKA